MTFKTVLPILIVLTFTGVILMAGAWSKTSGFRMLDDGYLNTQLNYQGLLLIVTAVSLLTTYLIAPEGFLNFLTMGTINAPATELKFFGIKKGDNWLSTGLSVMVFISLITATFMYFQLKKSQLDFSVLWPAMGWIVLFSLTNSFGEEMIYRLGVIAPLNGVVSPMMICWISAILFGLPHFAGMPSGVIGVLMAGVLGFVLSKSMLETNGFFWAWLIHFIQDVLIIGSLYLMSVSVKN